MGYALLDLDIIASTSLFVLSGILCLFLIHVNRLWSIDRKLVRSLFNSPTATAASIVDANSRLASGLKLLNTVLPLNEAVVFRCDESEGLQTVVRYKSPAPNPQDPRRNAVWREGIKLCQRAAATGELATQPGQNSSTVAVPLLHETETAGVLLIRLAAEFSTDDTPLLLAVGSQFARNLERESFSHNVRNDALSFFSQPGSKRKLDALNVLKAVTVEQRCEASTLAHIDDGVAIAYLDGTLASVNPTLMTFAGLTREQVMKMDLFDLLNKFRTDVFDEPEIAVRRVLQSGVEYEGELNFEAKSQILNLRISLLRDHHGKKVDEPIGIALYVKDLTATKEYEKLKSDMISLTSHELRTPLTSINGFAE